MLKIIARHKWVVGCTITESVDTGKGLDDKSYRRFTATVRGWRNWKIYEGYLHYGISGKVRDAVIDIRDRIDNHDESVWEEKGFYLNKEGRRHA